jgi:hypothetical protein
MVVLVRCEDASFELDQRGQEQRLRPLALLMAPAGC